MKALLFWTALVGASSTMQPVVAPLADYLKKNQFTQEDLDADGNP